MQRLDGLLEVSDEHGLSVPVYHLYQCNQCTSVLSVLPVGGLSSMLAARERERELGEGNGDAKAGRPG